jgi:hypothetical protein
MDLHVKTTRNGIEHDMPVQLSPITPMHVLKHICANFWNMSVQRIRLHFDGYILDDYDTPQTLNLKPGFQIDLTQIHLNAA